MSRTQFMGTANYNSLQVSARRRLSHGLQFGAAYTFSKALGDASTDTEAVRRPPAHGALTSRRATATTVL
jgi:hypothetical protein